MNTVEPHEYVKITGVTSVGFECQVVAIAAPSASEIAAAMARLPKARGYAYGATSVPIARPSGRSGTDAEVVYAFFRRVAESAPGAPRSEWSWRWEYTGYCG